MGSFGHLHTRLLSRRLRAGMALYHNTRAVPRGQSNAGVSAAAWSSWWDGIAQLIKAHPPPGCAGKIQVDRKQHRFGDCLVTRALPGSVADVWPRRVRPLMRERRCARSNSSGVSRATGTGTGSHTNCHGSSSAVTAYPVGFSRPALATIFSGWIQVGGAFRSRLRPAC